MIELIAQNLAPIMFVSVMAMLLIGYPVAFSLAAGGLIFFVIGVELSIFAPQEITLSWSFLGLHPSRTFDIMRNDTLVPALVAFFALWLAIKAYGVNGKTRLQKVAVLAILFVPFALPILNEGTSVVVLSILAVTAIFWSATASKQPNHGISAQLKTIAALISSVVFVIIGIRLLSLTFYGLGGAVWLSKLSDFSGVSNAPSYLALGAAFCVIALAILTVDTKRKPDFAGALK